MLPIPDSDNATLKIPRNQNTNLLHTNLSHNRIYLRKTKAENPPHDFS